VWGNASVQCGPPTPKTEIPSAFPPHYRAGASHHTTSISRSGGTAPSPTTNTDKPGLKSAATNSRAVVRARRRRSP
jgi:hypothetical protein